jgi:hypothetical protein
MTFACGACTELAERGRNDTSDSDLLTDRVGTGPTLPWDHTCHVGD